MKVLITGASGFLGTLLVPRLIALGWEVEGIDLVEPAISSDGYRFHKGDIRDEAFMSRVFSSAKFDAVLHLAAVLAHGSNDKDFLWSSNVEGTRQVAEMSKRYDVHKVVFTSSNCLWGHGFDRPVREDDIPLPIELYGRSKWEGEKILGQYQSYFSTVILRCPTIIEAGRLGLLSILFEFIEEGRRVWVVGDGLNRYQFIAAGDLIDALIKSVFYVGNEVFGIGSDDPGSLEQVYRYVITKANTGARIAYLPKNLAIPVMRICYQLGISPLGPYHYKMIVENFSFDTNLIKKRLNWKPTLTNEEMLYKAFEYYRQNKLEIAMRQSASPHRRAASMGVIRWLKWIS